MKKIYFLIAGLLGSTALVAQNYTVTFQVDMNNVTVSGNGVHVAGDFQSEAGASGDWVPSETQLNDPNNDGIYDVTVSIPAGRYEYKFINDNNWPGVEDVPPVAEVGEGNGNDNRYLWISSDTTLPAVLFAGAAPAGMKFVKLKVDMRNQLTPTSEPNVMGQWNGFAEQVLVYDPEGDSIFYNYVYWNGGDTMAYKFRNTPDWNDAESVTDPNCGGFGGFGNDRWIEVVDNTISVANCYGACGPCVEPPAADTINVTLRVDMSFEAVCSPPDSVDVTGAGPIFGNWGSNPNMMADPDNDDVYEITLQLLTNTDYEFKYRSWSNGNVKWESSPNRMLNITVNADTTLDLVCFSETGACSGSAPFGPANVTFAVDLGTESPGDTIWVMGSFTDPQWQGGGIPLTYSGEGAVFATTVEVCPNNFQFKFVNGDINTPANEEFNGDTAALPCNVSNGIGGYNRSVARTSPNDTVIAFFFGGCESFEFFPLGSNEISSIGSVSVFPNPFQNEFTVLSTSEAALERILVMDLTGRTIASVAGNNRNAVTISATDLGLNNGIYLIQVISADGSNQIVKVSSM